MTGTNAMKPSETISTPATRVLVYFTDGVCGIAVAAIVCVVLTQVAGRLLGMPFSWTEELTRACFI